MLWYDTAGRVTATPFWGETQCHSAYTLLRYIGLGVAISGACVCWFGTELTVGVKIITAPEMGWAPPALPLTYFLSCACSPSSIYFLILLELKHLTNGFFMVGGAGCISYCRHRKAPKGMAEPRMNKVGGVQYLCREYFVSERRREQRRRVVPGVCVVEQVLGLPCVGRVCRRHFCCHLRRHMCPRPP